MAGSRWARRGWTLGPYVLFRRSRLPHGVDECFDLQRRGGQPLETIVDVGAHTGRKTRTYARRFPGCRILAVEPVRGTFERLLKNTSGWPGVTCLRVALGSQPAAGRISLPANSQLSSLLLDLKEGTHAGTEPVEVTTLDELSRSHGLDRVDLLKIDTEGYDLQVLEGARGLLERRAIRYVLSEVGFHPEDRRHPSFFATHPWLAARGFRFLGLYHSVQQEPMTYGDALFALE